MASSCRAKSPRRLQKINRYKHIQDKKIKVSLNRLLKRYIDSGKINVGELDIDAMNMLKRRSLEVAEKSLNEYIKKKDYGIKNSSAFLYHIVKKVENDESIVIDNSRDGILKKNNCEKVAKKDYGQRSLQGHLSHYSHEKDDMICLDKDIDEKDISIGWMEKLFPSWLRGRGKRSGLFARG